MWSLWAVAVVCFAPATALWLLNALMPSMWVAGLLRLLTLSRRERPKRHRVFTISMVAVGVAALVGFSYPIRLDDLSNRADLIALVVLVLLPLTGVTYLLVKSWRFLLAAPADADFEARAPRT